MLRAKALVDYEKLRCANVTIFVDATDAVRSCELLAEHGEAIRRLAACFDARVLLVEEKRLRPESIIENDFADAWVLLVAEGRSRALTTKKNPHRFNIDTRTAWESQAFREIVRQVQESTRILEDVTAYYSRYVLAPEKVAAALRPGTN